GVRADIILAKNCGIDTDKGIIVNSRMETSTENIFACGDAVQFGCITPLWMPALKQGAVAGTNAAGGNDEFATDIYPATLKAFETTLFFIGNIEKEPGIEELSKIDDDKYLKLFYKNEKLDGAILINVPSKISAVLNAVKKGLSQKETADLI
ncbi:MAG TPA: rubredoxin, partial [bacterium]|nr:rubredoxin [bacterium]